MTKYKCGHKTKGIIVTDSSPVTISAYLRWSETVGINGDKSLCWECYCNNL